MSLHNSTIIENRKDDLLELTEEGTAFFLAKPSHPQTNSKPSEAGLNLRGGTAERSGVFGGSKKLATETERSGC